jgi:hypothetical protein
MGENPAVSILYLLLWSVVKVRNCNCKFVTY